MSILFDGTQYAEAASAVSASLPLALGCWFYLDDLSVDQTLFCLANSGSENNYLSLEFLSEKEEVTDITAVANVTSDTLAGKYFYIDSPTTSYYVWFDVDDVSTDPSPGSETEIEVDISAGDSAAVVAAALQAALDAEADFSASVYGDTVTVTNAVVGPVSDEVDVDTGFTINVLTQGRDATIEAHLVDNTGTLEKATSSGTVSIDTWHHALGSFSQDSGGTDIQVYLDGANVGSALGGSNAYPTGLNRTAIGRLSKQTPLRYASGRIAEVTVWDTLLLASEIVDVGTDKIDPLLIQSNQVVFHTPIYSADSPLVDIISHLNLTPVNSPVTANHPFIQYYDPETFARFRSGPVEFLREVVSGLTLQQIANFEITKRVSSSFGFNQLATHNVTLIDVQTNIGFTQEVRKNVVLNISVVQSLNFAQQMGPTTEESASSSIGFTQLAARAEDPSNDIQFTQAVDAEQSKGISNEVGFTQEVHPQIDLTIPLQNDVGFTQSVVAYIDIPCNRHEYDPQGGELPAVVFGVASQVTLVCGGASIALRNPVFGNSEASQVARALNVSRGGTPTLVRDSQWSKSTIIDISFEALRRTKALELLDFLQSCLGLLVTYTDQDDRDWEGIITNPEEAVIDEGDCKYSANIILEASPV